MAYKCPLCGRTHQLKQEMIDHVENNHADEMPKDMSTAQWLYLEAHNGNPGVCRYCGKPTLWNEKLGKYKQVCDSPACKAKVRKQYEERMMKSFGRIDVANDPELQKKMLANKKISGVYVWSDGRHKFTYTGSYEHSLIEWLDKVMDVDPETIQMPGVVIDYEMNGEKHFWITDLYLSDYNLVIEVKDGMENTHPGFAPNRAKEKAKDDYMRTQSQYNYLKLTHKNPLQLIKILSEIRMNNILGTDDKKDTKLIQINEAAEPTQSKVNISKITKDDIEDCRATLKKVFGVDSLRNNTRSTYKITNEKNDTVGYIGLSHYGSAMGFGNFAMKPEYQGHGYGTMVVNKLRDTHNGLLYCFVDEKNTKAISLYERLGTVHKDKKNKNNEYYVTFDKKTEVVKESTDITLADFDNDLVYSLCEAISSNYEETVELQATIDAMPPVTSEKTKDKCDTVNSTDKMMMINEEDPSDSFFTDGRGPHDQSGLRDIDFVEAKNEETDGGELRSDVDSDTEHFHTTGALSFIAHDVLNSSLKCTD